MKKVLLFSLIAVLLIILVFADYSFTRLDTASSNGLIVIWNSQGDYTYGQTLAQTSSDSEVVMTDGLTHATLNSTLNTDNILIEEYVYDSDPVVEVPSTIPERYEYTTLRFDSIDLYFQGTYWAFSPTVWEIWYLEIVYEGGVYRWKWTHWWDESQGQGGEQTEIAYKDIGQTPEGDYTGDVSITITIV